MLKTRKGDELICITQPDHAAVSGFLAARWGNDLFARPGTFAPSADPEKLRGEVLLGISQHDNGCGGGRRARALRRRTVCPST
jgi:hypothetical protein